MWDSDSKICMLIIQMGVCVCVRVCADGWVGDWSCHQLVEMTVDYWAAATWLPCGTSGMTCNFLTITFKMDSNFPWIEPVSQSRRYRYADWSLRLSVQTDDQHQKTGRHLSGGRDWCETERIMWWVTIALLGTNAEKKEGRRLKEERNPLLNN